MTASNIRVIGVHGIGRSTNLEIDSLLCDLIVDQYPIETADISEVNWSDKNEHFQPAYSLKAYRVLVRALLITAGRSLPAHHFGANAASWFNFLFPLAITALACVPFVVGFVLAVALVLYMLFSDAVFLYFLSTVMPIVVFGPLLWLLTIAPICSAVALPRRRLAAFFASLRSVAIALIAHVFAYLGGILLLPLHPYFALPLCAVILASAYFWPSVTLAYAALIGVALVLLRGAIRLPVRLALDIFRYIGDKDFRSDIQSRLEKCVSTKDAQAFILIGHSLGSVILLDSLLNSKVWNGDAKIHLVTMGSPIRRYFQWFFPGIFFPANTFQCFVELRSKFSSFRWLNIYRPFDYVGASIGLPETDLTAERSTYQVTKWHTGYWRDELVQKYARDWCASGFSTASNALHSRWDPEPYDSLARREKASGTIEYLGGCVAVAMVLMPLLVVSAEVVRCRQSIQQVDALTQRGTEVTCTVQRWDEIADDGQTTFWEPRCSLRFVVNGATIELGDLDIKWSYYIDSAKLLRLNEGTHTLDLRYLDAEPKVFVVDGYEAGVFTYLRVVFHKTFVLSIVFMMATGATMVGLGPLTELLLAEEKQEGKEK